MKKSVILLAMLVMFVSPLFAATYPDPPAKLILEGPDQRGEGALPAGGGKVKIDFYVSGVNGFSAIQASNVFMQGAADKSSLFILGPCFDPLPGTLPCWFRYNDYLWPSVFFVPPPFGFLGNDDKDCRSKTWLMSITYNYATSASGAYTVETDPALTVLGGIGGDPVRGNIDYTVTKGSFSISGWTIPGDVTGDCAVNVLDLIAVRNHMQQSPATGDNWKYDVNLDNKIDPLDLVFVRNRMGTRCAE